MLGFQAFGESARAIVLIGLAIPDASLAGLK